MGCVLSERETLHWEFWEDAERHRGEADALLSAGVGRAASEKAAK